MDVSVSVKTVVTMIVVSWLMAFPCIASEAPSSFKSWYIPDVVVNCSDAYGEIAFSPDSSKIICAGKSIMVVDVQTGKVESVAAKQGFRSCLAISKDGLTLAIGSSGQVTLWGLMPLKISKRIDMASGRVGAVALSSNASMLAASCEDGPAQIWDTQSTTLKSTVGNKGDRMRALAFSSDEKYLATLSSSGECNVWKMPTGELIGKLGGAGNGEQQQIVFLRETNLVAIVCSEAVTIWNFLGDTKPTVIKLPEHMNPRREEFQEGGGLMASPLSTLSGDGKKVATRLDNGVIAIWALNTRVVERILVGARQHDVINGGIERIVYSPDSEMLAALGSHDGKVRIWCLKDRTNNIALPVLDNKGLTVEDK